MTCLFPMDFGLTVTSDIHGSKAEAYLGLVRDMLRNQLYAGVLYRPA